MTVSPDTPPLVCASPADAADLLRERGLRMTSSRRQILSALFAAQAPTSAERLSVDLQLDLATVYRSLETFEELGLVRHVHLGHGPGLYALLADGEREYLYCERCGSVRALPPAELDPVRRQIDELFGHEAHFGHFPIVGVCPDCRSHAPARSS